MTNAERLRAYRLAAVANGLCYTCRCRQPRPGLRNCDYCIGVAHDGDKRRRREDAQTGLCTQCRTLLPLDCRFRRCEACRRDERARRAADRARLYAAGLCTRCGVRPHRKKFKDCLRCARWNLDRVELAKLRQVEREMRRAA